MRATTPTVRPMAMADMPASISGTDGSAADREVLDNKTIIPMNGVAEMNFFIVKDL
jgi:hypothetical protein